MGTGKSIPQPRAYNWTTVINGSFRPAASDVALWYSSSSPNADSGKHTAFITSASRDSVRWSPPKYHIYYTVHLSQYNANLQETFSNYNARFNVDSTPGSPPIMTVVQGIKFSDNSGTALAVWR